LIAPYDELGPLVKAFGGRLYFNLTQMRRVAQITRTPFAAMQRSIGHSGAIDPVDEAPPPRPPLRTFVACLPDFARLASRTVLAGWLFRRQESRIAAILERFASLDPSALPDDRLWSEIVEWERRSPEMLELVFLLSGVLVHELGLQKICRRVDFPFE